METRELEILERIARYLPVKKISLGFDASGIRKVYMAWGKDSEGKYIGLWGCRNVARDLHFKKGTPLKKVKLALVLDANAFVEDLKEHNLLNDDSDKLLA